MADEKDTNWERLQFLAKQRPLSDAEATEFNVLMLQELRSLRERIARLAKTKQDKPQVW